MDRFKQTRDYTFAAFIDNYKKMIIPNFQRAYSWSNKDITELWNAVTTNTAPYFIGNIVSIEASPEFDNRLQIVDGQQRLTTISLMLMAIRDKYLSIEPSSANDKEVIDTAALRINQYITGRNLSVVPVQDFTRMKLNNDSYQETFSRLIERNEYSSGEERSLNDIQKRIIRNYGIISSLIDQYVQTKLADDKELKTLDVIYSVEEKILNLQIIVIEVRTDNDVYSIFEGINSTGVGLSASDLIKNSILRYTSNSEKSEIAGKNWDQLEGIFLDYGKSDQLPRFLRHQWISENGYINNSELFTTIRNEKLVDKSPDDIIGFTTQLINDANVYMSIKEWKNIDQLNLSIGVKKELEKFHWLNNQQMYEVVLSYINRHLKKDGFRDAQLIKALNKLWNFAFRSSYVSVSPSAYERKFAEHCKAILECQPGQLVENINKFYVSLNVLVRSPEQFIENFATDMKYKQESIPLLRYIFKSIMAVDNPKIEVRNPTVEHILPQSPIKWGLQSRDVAPYVHKVGNLILLNDRENAYVSGNESFDTKVEKVFSISDFKLTNEICEYKTYTSAPESTIDQRGLDIASKVEAHFRLV